MWLLENGIPYVGGITVQSDSTDLDSFLIMLPTVMPLPAQPAPGLRLK